MQNQEDVLQEQKQADALPAEDVAADTAAAPAEPEAEQAEAGKPARRRAAREPVRLTKTIATANDMVEVETPEDRRAKDIDEIRRAIKQERILTAKVDGVEPFDGDNARIIGHRNSLKVVFEAKDFFHFSNMAGIEEASDAVRQQRYLRKARQMTEASVVFVPLLLSVDEETGMPFVVASRMMAMAVQREHHFLSERADIEKGVRTTATVISTGPAYAIVEALGVETTIGAAHLSAYEYIEDVSKCVRNGDGIEVMVTDFAVDRETGNISLRVSRAELERQLTPVETISSVRRGGVYSATVLLATEKMYKVVLEYKYRELEKRVKGQGMMIRRATFMMEECFASMVPVCTLHKDVERKARRNVLTSGASSCYPFISYEMQDPEGIMVGTNKHNNSLVSIDMFDTTAHPNANAVIIGATGSGKTFTAQLFALRLSLMNVQTFVIAPLKGREDYMGGCNAVGGQFVSMDPSAYNNINIMDIRVPDDEDLMRMEGYTDRGALLTKKIHTIKTFLGLVVRDLTQEEEQLLDTCLYSLYGRFGITTDNDSLFDAVTHEYKKMPLLGDLYEEMAGVEELHRVRNILSPLINGSLAAYNRPTNIDLDSKYIVFDFNGLKGDLLVLSMFIVLDFVWSKIKEDRTKRKAVFIDECWKLIGTDSNRRAAEDVVEIFRTIRAYGGSAFAMTQDVSQFFEFENGKYGKAVIGNADTKIVMHLQPNEAYMLQEAVQLTDAEIDNIIKLQTGHGFVASSGGKLFVEFLASPYEKYAITTDANEMYRRGQAIRAAKEKNG